MSRDIIFEVTGMHCAGCERLIVSILEDLPGVAEVEVSLRQERAGIRLRDEAPEPDIAKINEQIAIHGYRVYPKGKRPIECRAMPKIPWPRRVIRALGMMLLVSLVFVVLSPLRTLVPSVAASASVAALIGLGFVASVSTCLASTGAFLVAYTAKHTTRRVLVGVHLGRLLAFIVGGALLGVLGGALPQESGAWYGVLGIFLGIAFLAVGLNLLELTPPLSRFGIRLPRRLANLADRATASRTPWAPLAVGAATFVLPCGFTQTAQAFALGSGSALRGALLLGAFAFGTLPVLLGLSWVGGAALRSRALQFVTGAALVLFAFAQIDGALTVIGSPVTLGGAWHATLARMSAVHLLVPAARAEEQVVKMTVQYGTYQPKNLVVKKGVPVRWEINGIDLGGCASSLVVPSYAISRTLTPGLNVINFTPRDTGSIPFSCGMGMIRGSFSVVD